MKPTNLRSIMRLIICFLVLLLTTSAFALSRHNHRKNPASRENLTNHATEIGLADSSAANTRIQPPVRIPRRHF